MEDMEKNNLHKKRYFLVTPAKDEEKNLPTLIRSIVRQTIKPILWVIVNDGSNDRTSEIIKEAKEMYDWIETIHLQKSTWDLGIHISHVCRTGFDHAIECCNEHNIIYDYIGLVDADVVLDDDYFERLMKEFEKNPNLGIASGRVWNTIGNKIIQGKQREYLPFGGARLWSRQCFAETGGYLLTCSPDSVSNAKAILRGMETRIFNDIKYISTRESCSAKGHWRGYKQLGANNYFIGYTSVHTLLKGLKLMLGKPYYTGFAYLYGYFGSLILMKERIDDDEVRYYFRYIRTREISRRYIDKLKNILKISFWR